MAVTAHGRTSRTRMSAPDHPAARRERNRQIARAKATGSTWATVASRFDLSERQCRRAARDAEVLAAEERLEGVAAEWIHGRVLRVQSEALDRLEVEMAFGDNSSARVGAARAASTVASDLRASAAHAGLLPPGEDAYAQREIRRLVRAVLDGARELGVSMPELRAVLESRLGVDLSSNGAGP